MIVILDLFIVTVCLLVVFIHRHSMFIGGSYSSSQYVYWWYLYIVTVCLLVVFIHRHNMFIGGMSEYVYWWYL